MNTSIIEKVLLEQQDELEKAGVKYAYANFNKNNLAEFLTACHAAKW